MDDASMEKMLKKKDPNRKGAFIKPEVVKPVEEEIKSIVVPEVITVKELADKLKQPASALVKKLFLAGKMVSINQEITFEEAEEIALEYDCIAEKEVKVNIVEELLKEAEEDERKLAVVRMAIGTLSYSEAEAVKQIFNELQGTEGLLVASKIADRSGITRSVIVNALRKLESAGVIESRSLGMKGTHIKIVNSKFKDELANLN